MSNSRTSDASKAYQTIKDLFAGISGIANAATYERIGVGEAYARITEALEQIDDIVDTSLSRASNVVDQDVTPSGNKSAPGMGAHQWTGIKW